METGPGDQGQSSKRLMQAQAEVKEQSGISQCSTGEAGGCQQATG